VDLHDFSIATHWQVTRDGCRIVVAERICRLISATPLRVQSVYRVRDIPLFVVFNTGKVTNARGLLHCLVVLDDFLFLNVLMVACVVTRLRLKLLACSRCRVS